MKRKSVSATLLRLAATVLLLLALALTACGGNTTASSSPKPSLSAAASPTVSGTPLPTPTVAGTMAFTRFDWPHGSTDIYIVNTDGTGFKQLTDDGKAVLPSWSPDGSKIVYSASSGVEVMNADGSGQTVLVKGTVTEPSWSPDGKWIAFTKGVQKGLSGWAICVIRPDGSGFKRLTDGSGYDLYPSWTPDGRVLFSRDSENKVYTVKLDGSGLAPQGKYAGALCPDGSRLAVVEGDRVRVVAVRGGGTPVTVLHPLKDFISDELIATSWAPDGTAVTVATNQYEGATWGSRIYIVNADGTGLSAVPGVDHAFNPVWRPQ
jgi:TolB protein